MGNYRSRSTRLFFGCGYSEPCQGSYSATVLPESIDSAGFTIGLVDVDLSQIDDVAKRINITIPAGVLARIDAAANAAGMNRSAFLNEAAIKQMSS